VAVRPATAIAAGAAGLAAAGLFFLSRPPGGPEQKFVDASDRISTLYPPGLANYAGQIQHINEMMGGGFGLVEEAMWQAIGDAENPAWDPSAVLFEYAEGVSNTPRPEWNFVGASIGLFQLFYPTTAKVIAGRLGIDQNNVYQLMTPKVNARLALTVMNNINFQVFDIADQLASYNAGWPTIRALPAGAPLPNLKYTQRAYGAYLNRGGTLRTQRAL